MGIITTLGESTPTFIKLVVRIDWWINLKYLIIFLKMFMQRANKLGMTQGPIPVIKTKEV